VAPPAALPREPARRWAEPAAWEECASGEASPWVEAQAVWEEYASGRASPWAEVRAALEESALAESASAVRVSRLVQAQRPPRLERPGRPELRLAQALADGSEAPESQSAEPAAASGVAERLWAQASAVGSPSVRERRRPAPREAPSGEARQWAREPAAGAGSLSPGLSKQESSRPASASAWAALWRRQAARLPDWASPDAPR